MRLPDRPELLQSIERLRLQAETTRTLMLRESEKRLPAWCQVLPLATKRPNPVDPGETIVALKPEVPEQLEGYAARLAMIQAICQLDFVEGQLGTVSLRVPGVLGASNVAIGSLSELVNAKLEFERHARPLARQIMDLRVLPQFARLSLIYAYRKPAVLDAPPQRVAFAWHAGQTSSRLLTVNEARKLVVASLRRATHLHGCEREEIQTRDLAALDRLEDNEIIVKRRPLVRSAQVNWRHGDGNDGLVRGTKAVLPLVFPALPNHQLTEIVPLTIGLPDQRTSARSDFRCESEPIVERLHLYRHKIQHRLKR
jgi:hypothetical protein